MPLHSSIVSLQRRAPSWLRLWHVLLGLSIGITVLCWWSRGMGYRDRVSRWIDYRRATMAKPLPISSTKPSDGEGAVRFDTTASAYIKLPDSKLDLATLTNSTVALIRADDGVAVPTALSTLASGDRVVLTPLAPLDPETRYTLSIRQGIRDTRGYNITPLDSTFTTGGEPDPTVRFEQVQLLATSDLSCTAVVIGPDHRLYAGADDGRIIRYEIRDDGTLTSPTTIETLVTLSNGPRLLMGLCFDPKSTPEAPIVWVSHGFLAFSDAPDFSGRISRLSGPDLEHGEDVIINLPRSFRDHLTNQPSFGPDGALYFPQGSNTAFGAPDEGWGNRPERQLSASILRIDLAKLPSRLPVDVKTKDAGGSYDPFAPDAPLTIYAGGIRLAYDLCWAENGSLYVPTNGASAGGTTPAPPDGSAVSIKDVTDTEHDWLFRAESHKYYGHPNPAQGHYIFNGGNPTDGVDFAEVGQYPVGTKPDSQWTRAAFDFGNHVSPDGIIQYRSDVFGSHLKGKLLICRYNGGNDIITLTLTPPGDIKSAAVGIPGFGGLRNPLDLTEDATTGNIYVSEYGARRITLLRPIKPH